MSLRVHDGMNVDIVNVDAVSVWDDDDAANADAEYG